MTNKLIFALTYYNSPIMLREQIVYWQSYPDELASHLKVILIDDGSWDAAEKVLKQYPPKVTVELYRITKDIPQNVYGARNLAFHIASVEGASWVLVSDIDHVLPSRGLDGFVDLKQNFSTSFFYYPSRYEKTLGGDILPLHKHSDTFIITPELFWQVGGYDEDLTGYYYDGAAVHFRRAISRITNGVDISKVYTIFYPSSIIPDASPLQNIEKKRYREHIPFGKKPSVLNFEWERVL